MDSEVIKEILEEVYWEGVDAGRGNSRDKDEILTEALEKLEKVF